MGTHRIPTDDTGSYTCRVQDETTEPSRSCVADHSARFALDSKGAL